jgi:saccharopine dehydrogenase-like NADP-dependent oxidoreductase
MKHIIVLGGAGTMGSEVVRQLIERSDAKITAADANTKALKRVASELGDKIETSVIDVDDFNNLVQLMKNADVAISTVGPFYKYSNKLLKASIAAKVNFVDIDDDFDATKEALSLDDEAKKAGITAVIGIGASPGITNMIAKYGASKLDRVDEIRLFWAESAIDPTGPAALSHWFHIISGDIPIFKNGDWGNVKGFSEPEVVEFLPPVGKLEVRYTGHPEPVTLPRYIKGLKNVSIKGALFPPSIMELYKTLVETGFGSTETFIIAEGLSMPFRELSARIVRAMPRFAPEFFGEILKEALEKYQSCAGAFKIEVTGEKRGEEVQYVYDLVADSVSRGTATPAAMAALMIVDGKVKEKGVLAPEGALDISLFFSEMTREAQLHEREIRTKTIGKAAT